MNRRGVAALAISLLVTGCAKDFTMSDSDRVAAFRKEQEKPATEPPELSKLQEIPADTTKVGGGMPDLRPTAMRQAALKFGMEGGLARRTWEIAQVLERRSANLGTIYRFDALTIPVPAGPIMLPPIVTEASDALDVSDDGQTATAARQVYRILSPARIVTVPPHWRSYLVRQWAAPGQPAENTRPKDSVEREAWRRWVTEGWDQGSQFADETLASDLARLNRDFLGMIRYRTLVAQGVMRDLYLAQADMGVTGGGGEMRVGDRLVRISAPAQLNSNTADWKPILVPVEIPPAAQPRPAVDAAPLPTAGQILPPKPSE